MDLLLWGHHDAFVPSVAIVADVLVNGHLKGSSQYIYPAMNTSHAVRGMATAHDRRSGFTLPFPANAMIEATIQLKRATQFETAHAFDTRLANDCPSERSPVSKNPLTKIWEIELNTIPIVTIITGQ